MINKIYKKIKLFAGGVFFTCCLSSLHFSYPLPEGKETAKFLEKLCESAITTDFYQNLLTDKPLCEGKLHEYLELVYQLDIDPKYLYDLRVALNHYIFYGGKNPALLALAMKEEFVPDKLNVNIKRRAYRSMINEKILTYITENSMGRPYPQFLLLHVRTDIFQKYITANDVAARLRLAEQNPSIFKWHLAALFRLEPELAIQHCEGMFAKYRLQQASDEVVYHCYSNIAQHQVNEVKNSHMSYGAGCKQHTYELQQILPINLRKFIKLQGCNMVPVMFDYVDGMKYKNIHEKIN